MGEQSKLLSRVIGTFKVPDKKAKTTIDNFIRQLGDIDIASKIRIIVSDNATNMTSAFRNYSWVGCTAHDLALVQKYAFGMDKQSISQNVNPVLKELIDTCKDMVETVKRAGINHQLETRLKQEVETRWDTYYDMLESVYNNIESLKTFPILKQKLMYIEKKRIFIATDY